jgi:hypothetical protein
VLVVGDEYFELKTADHVMWSETVRIGTFIDIVPTAALCIIPNADSKFFLTLLEYQL